MRHYIGRHLLGILAAAVVVVVVALCGGWPGYESVAQVDDAADNGTLTVGQCIEVNASVSPLDEALIKEDIIEEDLLQTEVTDGMCKDMLEPIADGTQMRRLIAAQSYIQEIKLINGAIRRAGSRTAAKGTDRHFLAAEPSGVAWTVVAAVQGAAEAQYHDGEDPRGGDGEGPRGGDGEGNGSEVTPTAKQAATISECSELSGAEHSYDEVLAQCEAAAEKAGASSLEAAAGAHCGLEVDVLDDEAKKIKGLYEIRPLIPEKMRHRETAQAGLLVQPATKKRFQEIRQEHADIAGASESDIGCVVLTNQMKAKLVPLGELGVDHHQSDDIRELSANRDTIWGWDITARQTGTQRLLLDLSYAISREGQEFRQIPESPVHEGEIRVTPLQSDSNQDTAEQPWWRRIFEGVLERISKVFGA